MEVSIKNNVVDVSSLTRGELDIYLHARQREMEAGARYYGDDEGDPNREPYICLAVALKEDEKAPTEADLHAFLTIPQAAAIVTALAGALAKHVDERGHPIPYTPEAVK
jgi:hypothetical protein